MSGIALFGGALVVLLLNVVGGIVPIQMTGDVQLAYWLLTLLAGVVAYSALNR